MLGFNRLIKNNFDQAASGYIANAEIQRIPALKIINLLDTYYQEGVILDLGSGPGTLQHNSSHNYPTLAFDLSTEMLKNSRSKYMVNGDAGNLPFAANSFSLIISNLMLQWPQAKTAVLDEVWRVLKPGGTLLLTTLIKPSLFELQQAWCLVDDKPHTLEFLTADEYLCMFKSRGFKLVKSGNWQTTYLFPTLPTLLWHFKTTGTGLAKSSCNQGLGGRKRLQQLAENYQRLAAKNNFLPLTYAYLLVVATKAECRINAF